jgi:polygalacturonase
MNARLFLTGPLGLGVVALLLAATRSKAAEPAAGLYSPADYGAVFDGKANDGPALQKAIDAAAAAGGGTVVMPAGRTSLSGSIELKSHVTLRLDPGSRIVASLNPADYTEAVLVRARKAEEVAITGTGTIDGQGDLFMESKGAYIYHAKRWRPKLVMLEEVRGARLSNFTLRNSPEFTVQLRGCDDVGIQGISIYNNPEIPNNDGIDPVCSRNVRIDGCTVVTGDDCIAISNTDRDGPRLGACDGIVVSHCVLSCQDSALKIGSGTFGPVRNVIFSDCVVNLALRGVDIMARDGGDVENVVARNILIHTHLFAPPWWGASEAVYVTAVPRTVGQKMGHVRHVRISGIVADGESGVFIRGTPESPIEDVLVEDVTLAIAKTTPWPSRIDVRPSAGEKGPRENAVIGAFDLQDVNDITLRNCIVRWAPNPPANFGPLIQQVRVAGLRVENLRGADAHAAPVNP